MKRNGLSVVAALLFILLLASPGVAWQGRMAGVVDASGLIEDESDYLTHPASIASGKGFNAYGHYRLTYDKATAWDYKAESAFLGVSYPYKASGYEWRNQLQLGSAFALGAGRMGVFFEYEGARGKYTGDEKFIGFFGSYNTFDMENKLDNLKLRLLYGLPIGAVNVGGELQIAYIKEEKETMLVDEDGRSFKNDPWAAENNTATDLFPYMIPFQSKYWEAQGKVSVDGKLGAAKYAATLKAGLPFASDNQYVIGSDFIDDAEMSGQVKGFHVGGDVWVRVPLSGNIVLPFVAGAGYKTVKRDGSGVSLYNSLASYEHTVTNVNVKLGGGADITLAKDMKLAMGLYYDYISIKQDAFFKDILTFIYYVDNYTDMPKSSEHRVTLKALAEKELTPAVVLRGGFSAFYGKVENDYAYNAYDTGGPYLPVALPTSGSNRGVNASIGATVKLDRISLEPFLNAGYAKYSASGDGKIFLFPASAEFEKTNWLVGGGLSVKF